LKDATKTKKKGKKGKDKKDGDSAKDAIHID
jgi:hypothetical protein